MYEPDEAGITIDCRRSAAVPVTLNDPSKAGKRLDFLRVAPPTGGVMENSADAADSSIVFLVQIKLAAVPVTVNDPACAGIPRPATKIASLPVTA